MSEKSPYREVGISAYATAPKRIKVRKTFTWNGRESSSLGHGYDLEIRKKRTQLICRYCHRPQFAVWDKKCKGAKK